MKERLSRLAVMACLLGVFGGLAVVYPVAARGSEWLSISLQHPWALLLLALVPVVLWRGTLGEDARLPRLRIGTVAPLASAPGGWRLLLRDAPGVMRALALALIALCLARPVSLNRPDSADESGIDIVITLDLSNSMNAIMDATPAVAPKLPAGRIRPTRLDVAKEVILDFISRRKTDRIGVVVFAKSAYVLSPPTLDYHLLDTLVSKMSLELIDGTATAIGDAVGVSAARLRRSEARSKTIVLLTDGDSNAGAIAPEHAAELASKVGARIYTIQIGNGDDVEVQEGVDLFGQPIYRRRNFPVNPELLHKIAADTGGRAYVATDGKALSESMHDVLDRLEKTRFEGSVASYEDLFPLLLLPAALLIALDALARAWLLRRFP